MPNGKFRLDSQSALSTVFFPISDAKKGELKKQLSDELSKLGLLPVARIGNQDVFAKDLPASSKHLCLAIKEGGTDRVLGCTEGVTLQADPLKKEAASAILSRAGFSLVATIPSLSVSKTEQYLYSKSN